MKKKKINQKRQKIKLNRLDHSFHYQCNSEEKTVHIMYIV